jgi:acyl-CoA synthetase (AMP-forming)/AMP-acid ligase II
VSPLLAGAPSATTGFWGRLAAYGDRPALVTADGSLSYAGLAARVRDLAARLGGTRRLVLVAGANDVDAVVAYLAALAAGHPAILVPGDNQGNLDAIVDAYDPDVLLRGGDLVERRPGTVHDLHPDLALMLSTSGSTGSPKLVRLSHENLAANAEAIAAYLRIRPRDVAATTLPMHYCYGLSVINSHLAAGASLLLTDLSVVDTCFWDAVRTHRVTTFAGVPYTFDLLDRVGFADMDLPSLRYLTQAGGRLAPARVRDYADLGRRRGWDLFVMYGQTEATARMAYLPPDLAATSPSSVGVPIPGGSFALEPLPELPLASSHGVEVGELVYTGANVMLGYATSPADLGRGRDVDVLRTGDVARRTADGLYEIIGRRNRFAKVFGLRIDLDQVEQVYAGLGHVVHCADGDERLVLAVDASARPVDADALRAAAKAHFGLPARAVQVLALTDVPRLPTGKPDYRSIAARAQASTHRGTTPHSTVNNPPLDGGAARLRAVFADVLGRPDATEDDSFVSLEGDSLSYVEMSVRLEAELGALPAGWHTMRVRDLAATPAEPRRGRTLETNVLLRALAIVMIVGTHANLFALAGGAHVLLGVAGFNFGRFHLTAAPRADRVRHLLTSVNRVVVPSVLWLGAVAVTTRDIGLTNVLLLNGVLGPREWTEPQWWYWFIEALVAILLVLTVVMAVPWVDRLERRWSFWLPFGLAVAGLATRYDLVRLFGGDEIHRAHVVFWLFALGWATVKSTTWWQRALVSAVVLATLPGFFDSAAREAIVAAGMLALVWLRAVRVPGWLARATGVLAAASLYIYLAHWQIYPHLEDRFPLLATVLSLAGGIAFWQASTRAVPAVAGALRRTPGG